jgi:cytosine/adenosine deaminase-related metal-dependent hydrolase
VLVTNGRVVTWSKPNRLLEDHPLRIAEGKITEIGPTADLRSRHPDADVMDAAGQLVMPGNICAHAHLYGAFAWGMAVPGRAPGGFVEGLRNLRWPPDRAQAEDDVRDSALVCLIVAIRHGSTTLIDHRASPNTIDGSLDVIGEAAISARSRQLASAAWKRYHTQVPADELPGRS